jgi:hypothetical protein
MGGGPAGRGGGAMIGPPCGGTVMAGSCRGIGATAVAHCNPGCVMGLTCGDGGAIKAALWVGSAPRAPAMGHPGCRSDHAGLVDRVGGKHGRVGGGGVRGGPVDGTGGEEGRVGGAHIRRLVAVGARPAGSVRRNGLGFPETAAGVGDGEAWSRDAGNFYTTAGAPGCRFWHPVAVEGRKRRGRAARRAWGSGDCERAEVTMRMREGCRA